MQKVLRFYSFFLCPESGEAPQWPTHGWPQLNIPQGKGATEAVVGVGSHPHLASWTNTFRTSWDLRIPDKTGVEMFVMNTTLLRKFESDLLLQPFSE